MVSWHVCFVCTKLSLPKSSKESMTKHSPWQPIYMLATFVVIFSKPKPTIYIGYHDMFAMFVANFSKPKLSRESMTKHSTWQFIYMLATFVVNFSKPRLCHTKDGRRSTWDNMVTQHMVGDSVLSDIDLATWSTYKVQFDFTRVGAFFKVCLKPKDITVQCSAIQGFQLSIRQSAGYSTWVNRWLAWCCITPLAQTCAMATL